VPASDTINFGIIGVGQEGEYLLGIAIKLPGVKCIAACDLYDGRQELAREIVDGPITTTRRYKELLANKDVDCIIVAVPAHWHKQIVVDTVNAAKDVYCEKPMTHRVEEGFEIIDAATKTGRIVQIGSQRQSSLGFAKAKELCDQGAIGDVCLASAVYGRNDACGAWQYQAPPDLSPQTLDWETWLGTAPSRPFDVIRWARWRCFQDYGEGLPGDLFVHSVTGIHYVMNVDAPPERALSSGGLFRWKDGRDVPDVLTTLYDYPKFRATVQMTLNTDISPEVTRFMGTRGMIKVDGEGDGGVRVYPQDGWENLSILVQRSVVCGKIYETKTEASHKPMPIDPELAKGLLEHRRQATYVAPGDYIFAGDSGKPRWHGIMLTDHIKPPAVRAAIGKIGWHTFRHTFSSILHHAGTDLAVQKELPRHADIQTTINMYTQAVSTAKREAVHEVAKVLLNA
jgi:predicted dehydrogenase